MLTPQEEYDRLVAQALAQSPAEWDGFEDDDEDDFPITSGQTSRLRRLLLIIITVIMLISFLALELAPILQGQPTPQPPVYFPAPTIYPRL